MLASAMAMDCQSQSEYEPVRETYIVQEGDTIDGIAHMYFMKNETRRYFLEFREGIYEENFWARDGIYPGDEIIVNYWIKKNKEEE